MSNSTEELSVDTKWELFRHTLYIVQGLANVVFNSLIVVTIGRFDALRYTKEYVALGAAAFTDALESLGTICAGLYRIPVWLTHNHLTPASSRFCLLTPHSMIWSWFSVNSKAMLVVLSLDRILSVAKPLQYHSRSYVVGMVSVAYGMSFAVGASLYISQWHETEPVHTKICWTTYAYGMDGEHLRNTVSVSCTLMSIGLYLLVPILFCYKQNEVGPMGAEGEAMAEFQKQLNKSVALSCLFTFVFVALPWMVMVILSYVSSNHDDYESVAVWAYIIAGVDPMINLYIYYKKLIHFRKGLKALWQNKALPVTLNQW